MKFRERALEGMSKNSPTQTVETVSSAKKVE